MHILEEAERFLHSLHRPVVHGYVVNGRCSVCGGGPDRMVRLAVNGEPCFAVCANCRGVIERTAAAWKVVA
ncbi:MAG: hypothetical protein KGL39_05585 [Patescibacteria group bacterium]|nr:hypothetical protein [Patescibacteria group bacterium]